MELIKFLGLLNLLTIFIVNKKKHLYMKSFILTLLLLFSSLSIDAKSPDVNIYFVYENSSLTSLDIKNQIDFIYFKNNIKANNFNIMHYTKNNETDEIWGTKNKKIIYKPTKTNCDFSICNNLLTLINYQVNKEDINKFYTCETKISCNLRDSNFEVINLSNKNESTLINILSKETKQKTDKKINLYFYFSDNSIQNKPTISFESDSISYTEGNLPIKLSPLYSNNIKNIFWDTIAGLSCFNCKYPSLKPDKSQIIKVFGTDTFGCKSEIKTIKIDFIKNCSYGKGECRLIFDDPNANFEAGKKTSIYDYKIYSEIGLEKVFYVLAKPNCASNFRVIIKNKKDTVYDKKYKINDVEKSWRNTKFNTVNFEHFSFRLPMESVNFGVDDFYIIEIHSFDEQNNKFPTYVSPKISFSQCKEDYDDE